jgi:hypothetical protein
MFRTYRRYETNSKGQRQPKQLEQPLHKEQEQQWGPEETSQKTHVGISTEE